MKIKKTKLGIAIKHHARRAKIFVTDPSNIQKVKHAGLAFGLEKLVQYLWSMLF